LRHGLAAIAPRDPATSAEIERLARWFCGEGATPEQYEHARAIAEEHIMLQRVETAYVAIFERAMNTAHDEADHTCSTASNSERTRRVTRCPASTSQIGSLQAARTRASSTGRPRFRCGLGSSSIRRREARGLSAGA
jgi:hypothetical protein